MFCIAKLVKLSSLLRAHWTDEWTVSLENRDPQFSMHVLVLSLRASPQCRRCPRSAVWLSTAALLVRQSENLENHSQNAVWEESSATAYGIRRFDIGSHEWSCSYPPPRDLHDLLHYRSVLSSRTRLPRQMVHEAGTCRPVAITRGRRTCGSWIFY